MTDDRPPTSYAEAMAELETLLDALEAADADVDLLVERVRRAAVLVRFCRSRLDGARLEVEQITAELDEDDSSSPSASPVDGSEPAVGPSSGADSL
ncbi:MAG: exodeoxyribonuclease VII small subunit [Acidimicrobiia bacterium]|nr:exodeoxyribonuclease VII small subunit [Acidimicrobiia bacterium]